ncbi:MAG: VWA domain-containing protein [Flavobacteriales bacterium]|nr:VWA domain-containing protein [Flavobacteriales bacterium]
MIKRGALLLFLFLLFGQAEAQFRFSRQHVHFGIIGAKSERFTDFELKNTSGKKAFILRTECDKDVSVLYSNRTLMPDSTITVRVQYNPKETGKFQRQIQVYVSALNEPLIISISGEVNELPSLGDLACPDFNRVSETGRVPNFEMEVLVINAHTGENIIGAKVSMIYLGIEKYRFISDRSGKIIRNIDLGYYYFISTASGFKNKEFDRYVNVRNNKVVIEMIPIIEKGYDQVDDSLFYRDRPDPIVDPNKPKELEPLLTTEDQLLSPKDSTPIEIEKPEISIKESPSGEGYKTNNLVFLIDVSASMMMDGKMDLLKMSMIELCAGLGPDDKVSLVVYSSQARVIMDNISGSDKQTIIDRIRTMEGSGNTAGSEGMKLAYEMAMRHFIPNGNNQVIMATDGAFNLYTSDVAPLVKRYYKKGIVTSVLAIKNTERDAKSMESIATMGGGRYVPIVDAEGAKNGLIEEVRSASKR